MSEVNKHYKHIVDDTNGKSLEELKSDFLAEMCEQRLDGKAELEKALATKGDIDWSKIVTTNNTSLTCSFLERENLAIEFESRDALLTSLCQRVFGAAPTYADETPMRANVDVINDFTRLQAANQDLTRSNIKLAGDLLELQQKVEALKNHPAYAKTFGETETIEENPKCGCRVCNPTAWWMVTCGICGNKRCPHGTNHEHACTGSNEHGQEGSVYK